MIISKAPLRISFFGGGTDIPEWFNHENRMGYVFGGTINQYVYVYGLPQPTFEKTKLKFSYRNVEEVSNIDDLSHPTFRILLKEMNWDEPLNAGTFANLPGRSGLGSSSSFLVAAIKTISKLQKVDFNQHEIAKLAIKIEREILEEAGGWQDQLHASFSGTRAYTFNNGSYEVLEKISDEKITLLNKSIFLLASGEERKSSDLAEHTTKIAKNTDKDNPFKSLADIAKEFTEKVYSCNTNALLNVISDGVKQTNEVKNSISHIINSQTLKQIKIGINSGAMAAKLCGAGGSGFILFICDPNQIKKIATVFPEENIIFPKLLKSKEK